MPLEKRSSGIDVENSKFDELLEICVCAEEYELHINAESEAGLARKNEDQATAEEMRHRSMENVSETSKRKTDEQKKPRKKSRQGGNQTVMYLLEKLEKEAEIQNKEQELRHAELEAEKQTRSNRTTANANV